MGRNFSPARKVRSMTAPSAARLSLVRTKAPPLPGLTCWNSTMRKTVPSTSMWVPFLNWLVLITDRKASRRIHGRQPWEHAARGDGERDATTAAGGDAPPGGTGPAARALLRPGLRAG